MVAKRKKKSQLEHERVLVAAAANLDAALRGKKYKRRVNVWAQGRKSGWVWREVKWHIDEGEKGATAAANALIADARKLKINVFVQAANRLPDVSIFGVSFAVGSVIATLQGPVAKLDFMGKRANRKI